LAGGHDRSVGKTGKSASRCAASRIRSPCWCKDSLVLHARGGGASGGMKPLWEGRWPNWAAPARRS